MQDISFILSQYFLCSHSTTMETFATFSKSLQKDLDSAWLFMGPVSDLPNGCFLKFDESNVEKRLSPSSHLLHLHLETKWCFIEILWKLYSLEGSLVSQFANVTPEHHSQSPIVLSPSFLLPLRINYINFYLLHPSCCYPRALHIVTYCTFSFLSIPPAHHLQ